MSAPFYTSESLSGENIDWSDIDARKFPEYIVSSCPGVVVRIWLKDGSEEATPCLVTAWGVYFTGLDYIGSQLPKEANVFADNTVVFSTSWGYFTAGTFLKSKSANPEPVLQEVPTGKSYSLATMCSIHRLQRAIYKDAAESERLRQDIQSVQTNPYRYQRKSRSLSTLATSPADYAAIQEMQVKRQEILYIVNMLQHERNRQLKKVEQLKESLKNLKSENHSRNQQAKEDCFQLQVDKDKLSDLIKDVAVLEDQVWRVNQQLVARRRQLFQELAFIFPIVQVKEKVYSINGVVLPDSDSFAGCDDTQLSVALGYVAHLVHMISVFIQVPNRYPITVYSSLSRITDLITRRETDVPKEFPLYAKGKDRLHFEYGVYLLNKNIAQLRWLFGMPTANLAATLPNVLSLMQHLTTPPPSEDKKPMRAVEAVIQRTSSGPNALYRYKSSKWQPQRASSLAGSQVNLAEDHSASTLSLDERLADSPQQSAGAYFRRVPEAAAAAAAVAVAAGVRNATSSTLSLDLAVDRLAPAFHRARIDPAQRNALHGSAPDLRSPETSGPRSTVQTPGQQIDPSNSADNTKVTSVATDADHNSEPSNVNNLVDTKVDLPITGTDQKDEPFNLDEETDELNISKTVAQRTDDCQLLSTEKATSDCSTIEKEEFVNRTAFDTLFIDDEINSVSARTEALAISTGTFKMTRRGQSSSLQGNG